MRNMKFYNLIERQPPFLEEFVPFASRGALWISLEEFVPGASWGVLFLRVLD